jgi:hypothetical protein
MDSSTCIEAPDYYTWCEFKNEVLALMPQDANRIGMEDYLPRLIREAVIDLQQFIPAYRKRHETIYYPTDFVREGSACVGTLPPQCQLQGVWLFRNRNSERFEVERFPWERRFELVNSRHRGNDELGTSLMTLTASSVAAIELINRLPVSSAGIRRYGLMAVDPQGDSFYLHPAIENGWLLSINWNGRKLDYRDDELVPFEEPASYAVASWAKSKIAMEVDRDLQRAEAFFAEYAQKRVNLYLELKEQGHNI